MAMQLSERVQQVKPSPTLAVSARAAELRASGKDIISLSVGEPDFDTPDFIKEAAIKALNEGFTKYTAVDGIPELKNAIRNKFSRDNQLDYGPKQILVSCGAKQAIYNLMQAFLNAGDEVIIPAPYWVSYPDMALLAEATPVTITTKVMEQFKLTPQQLSDAITPKTRLLILNSPSNPTGISYTKAELAALGEVLLQHPHVLIATDDMYEHILWSDEPFANIVNACPELKQRTIVFNGVSKAYSMTGWRIGYAAGDEKLIAAMKKIQSQSTSNPNSIAQKAATAALDGDQSCINEMVNAFKQRHDFIYQQLNAIEGVTSLPCQGTFYTFPDVSELINRNPKLNNDVEFCEMLLNEANIAVVPGSAFGSPGCIRISFAVSMQQLETALERFKSVI